MKSCQSVINDLQELTKRAFLKEGINFLICEANNSFEDLRQCSLDSEEGLNEFFRLAEQLRSEVACLCSLHQKWTGKGSPDLPRHLEQQKLASNFIESQFFALQSELKIEKRKNSSFMKVNLRLKRKIRRLRRSLTNLKKGFGKQLQSSESRLQTTLSCEISALKSDLVNTQRRLTQATKTAQQEDQSNVDSLVARLQQCLKGTQSIQEQSERLSTKIDDLSDDLTEKVNQVPSKVKRELKLTEWDFSHSLAKTRAVLEERSRDMVEYANFIEERARAGFLRMRDIILQIKELKKSYNDHCPDLTLKLQKSCKEVSEKVENESKILSNRIGRITLGMIELSELLIDNPIYKQPRDRVSILYQSRLRSIAKEQVEGVELVVEKAKGLEEEGLIGDEWTHVALKNRNSYMIGTMLKGLKIKENGALVYSGKLPEDEGILTDMIYVESLNCYLIASLYQIKRKDIDEKPPYLYMNYDCGSRIGGCFRFSKIHERLIVSKHSQNISAIDLERKQVEIEVENGVGNDIIDFRLFGEQENRVIAVTGDGHVILYSLDYTQKRGSVVNSFNIELNCGRKEMPKSLSVCDKNEYCFVEIGQSESDSLCSRMILFKIRGDSLIKKASIDQHSQNLGHKYALESLGYFGRFILWVGLSMLENGVAQLYVYNTETSKFKELVGRRLSHREEDPVKIHRVGSYLYYTGRYGRLMRLRVKFTK